MSRARIPGSFTEQPSIPEAGSVGANPVKRSGQLRHTMAVGEESGTGAPEREYPVRRRVRYCLVDHILNAVASFVPVGAA